MPWTPGGGFEQQNNSEGSPKDPYIKVLEDIRDKFLLTVTQWQQVSAFPQNFEQYKTEIERIFNESKELVTQANNEYEGKVEGELLISTIQVNTATAKLTESMTEYYETLNENIKNTQELVKQITLIHKEADTFFENQDENTKKFLRDLQEKYIHIIFAKQDELLEAKRQPREEDSSKDTADLLSHVGQSEGVKKFSSEYENKVTQILKDTVDKCENLERSIKSLFISDSHN